ncbi:DUF6221 family protein [Actinomadura bangladeshensis]|uniref:Uncharacterized protein n=1 Tax=Actinomadura bangladeshensis TaxID=453573 RepID=A0A6L9QAX9_9ACTN|nr:DUF6221 family protein [Actinomadura bangladeshensis]NEA21601.1 hypothetical protein [Actinomadura bangladeshensis]NEA22561.1 hypothetical protein [Actinomadura bangladeshensis]
MNDLVRWLGVQLDADERRERGKYVIHGSTVIKCPQCPNFAYTVAEHSYEVTFNPCGHTMDGDEFVKTFGTPDPDEFVLADIAAKRLLIAEHGIEAPGTDYQHCRVCHDYTRHDAARAPCRTLRLLALPYAGRAGYDERWRPVPGARSGKLLPR